MDTIPSPERDGAALTPLANLLVVDLTRYLPGPWASAELLRLGARVVRLEPPSGDPLRMLAPGWHGRLNAGKESVVCDLKAEPELGRALCARADIVLEGFRPGVVDRLGVGPSQLPTSVVYCSIRGFGEGSEWFMRAGHDVNYLGLAGVLDPERPTLPPIPIADLAAGALTAVARVLAGLVQRASTGLGSVHAVSMTDEAHRLVSFRRDDEAPTARLLSGGFACYDLYQCSDGRWLSIGALEQEFFANLCEALGRPELGKDQYVADAQDALRDELASILRTRSRDDWVTRLSDRDACVAPVMALDETTLAPSAPSGRASVLGRETQLWRRTLGL